MDAVLAMQIRRFIGRKKGREKERWNFVNVIGIPASTMKDSALVLEHIHIKSSSNFISIEFRCK